MNHNQQHKSSNFLKMTDEEIVAYISAMADIVEVPYLSDLALCVLGYGSTLPQDDEYEGKISCVYMDSSNKLRYTKDLFHPTCKNKKDRRVYPLRIIEIAPARCVKEIRRIIYERYPQYRQKHFDRGGIYGNSWVRRSFDGDKLMRTKKKEE